MSLSTLLAALVIFCARVVDMSLATFRQAMVIRGKRFIAMGLAFVESLIWIYAVSRVLSDLGEPVMALAYAGGFAAGTFVGITVEDFFKIGEQVVRIFSKQGAELASGLRAADYRVTIFHGEGRDGEVELLFVQVPRRTVAAISKLARGIDPRCYIVVDDIRASSYGSLAGRK